jgi:hypothetical protein
MGKDIVSSQQNEQKATYRRPSRLGRWVAGIATAAFLGEHFLTKFAVAHDILPEITPHLNQSFDSAALTSACALPILLFTRGKPIRVPLKPALLVSGLAMGVGLTENVVSMTPRIDQSHFMEHSPLAQHDPLRAFRSKAPNPVTEAYGDITTFAVGGIIFESSWGRRRDLEVMLSHS